MNGVQPRPYSAAGIAYIDSGVYTKQDPDAQGYDRWKCDTLYTLWSGQTDPLWADSRAWVEYNLSEQQWEIAVHSSAISVPRAFATCVQASEDATANCPMSLVWIPVNQGTSYCANCTDDWHRILFV